MAKPSSVRWLYQWPRDGIAQFRIGRAGDHAVAEWVGRATLHADMMSGSSNLVPACGSDPTDVADLLRTEVSALLRHLRGEVTMHASCVAYDGGAIAFIGQSGAGKSTIAALLCRNGVRDLVSDDLTFLQVDGSTVRAFSPEDSHSLRPDVAKALGLDPGDKPKLIAAAPRRASGAVLLEAVVSLVFDDSVPTPVLRPMHGAEAFTSLSLSTVRFVLDEPAVLRTELDTLSMVARQAHFYELRRARDLTNMDAAAREAGTLFRRTA